MFGKKKSIGPITYLAEGSEFQGTLRSREGLRVDGTVRGTVEVEGDIEIWNTGSVEGPEMRGRNILIHGSVKASVVAEGNLTLTRTARLEGDVVANALHVEAGAFYVGHIVTKDAKALPVAQSATPRLLGRSEE